MSTILYGTPLKADRALFEGARDALTRIADERHAEWRALTEQEAGVAADNKPALNAIRYQKQRASGAYLLSELAAEGFLPGYGFPTGIAPLVTDSVSRRRQDERRREDSYARSRDYPSRQLDIALFEYAPGTTLVLDGLVYTSSGITLNWHGPASVDGVREIQALRTAWRCHACGAAGVTSTAARPDVCAMCGSVNLDCRDHIAPKGFAVDIRDTPHDDTIQVSHLLHHLPWVHASGADWLALPDGGRVRSSLHGIVYLSNSGEEGHGYAVCLQCGRTAAETEPDALSRPLPPGLNDRGAHRPLRGAPKDEHGLCPGSTSAFSIKRNLELGHSIRTAVVEVQLYDCHDPDTARAVAVALREACAIELGIEPDEMGFAATAALSPARTESWCAVVYDRASGGAGFASTIADDPVNCLKAARDLLDCTAPGGCGDPLAERLCSRCLLSSDTQHVLDRCNRLTAFQLLNDLIPQIDEIAVEDRLFDTRTELESMPLATALSRRITQAPSRTIVLWLHGRPEDWEFDEWPPRTLAETWGPRGTPLRIVVRLDVLQATDQSVRETLVRLVDRCQAAELVEWIDPPVRDATPLAALVNNGQTLMWASRDASAGSAGPGWGRSSIAPVVRGPMDGALFGSTVDLSKLLVPRAETAVVELGGEADGSAIGFGLRLRRAIEAQSGDLFRRAADGPLKEITYVDRYVFSPLSVLLAVELVGAFARRTEAKVTLRTRPAPRSVHATPPWQIQHDWTIQAERRAVTHELLSRTSHAPRINLDDATPHRRTLVLRWERGALEITFDQGIGPWLPTERCRFDFGKSAEEQAQTLLKTAIHIENVSRTFVVVRKVP